MTIIISAFLTKEEADDSLIQELAAGGEQITQTGKQKRPGNIEAKDWALSQ